MDIDADKAYKNIIVEKPLAKKITVRNISEIVAIKARQQRRNNMDNTDFYSIIVFSSKQNKDEFHKQAGWPDGCFIDGNKLAEKYNINLTKTELKELWATRQLKRQRGGDYNGSRQSGKISREKGREKGREKEIE